MNFMTVSRGLHRIYRGLSLFLTIALVIGLLPIIPAFATSTIPEAQLQLNVEKEGPYYVGDTISVYVTAPESATVFYTLTGDEPTEDSMLVTDNTILVSAEDPGTVVVKVLAVVEKGNISETLPKPGETSPSSEGLDSDESQGTLDSAEEQAGQESDESGAQVSGDKQSGQEAGEGDAQTSGDEQNGQASGEGEIQVSGEQQSDQEACEGDAQTSDEVQVDQESGKDDDQAFGEKQVNQRPGEGDTQASGEGQNDQESEEDNNSEASNLFGASLFRSSGDSVSSAATLLSARVLYESVDDTKNENSIEQEVTVERYTASLELEFEAEPNVMLLADNDAPDAPKLVIANDQKIYSLSETATISVTLQEGVDAYYTTDGSTPTTSSEKVEDGKITVSPPDSEDGGIVTVKVVSAITSEEDTIYSEALSEVAISFYVATYDENGHSISLSIDGGTTYYFVDSVSAFTAVSDSNLQTGDMTLTALKDATITFDSNAELFTGMPYGVTLDVNGNVFTLAGSGGKRTLYINAKSFVITDSTYKDTEKAADDSAGGCLEINECQFTARSNLGLLAIKNVSVKAQATSSAIISIPTSVKTCECEIENAVIDVEATSGGNTLSIHQFSIKNSVIRTPGTGISISYADSENAVIESSSIIAGATAVILSTRGNVTIESGYFEGNTLAINASSANTSAVLKDGVYNGALKASRATCTITIEGGYYKTDQIPNWDRTGNIVVMHVEEREGEGEYEGYTQYVSRTQYTATVTLDAPDGVVTIDQDVGDTIAVYAGEVIEYNITCLPDYAIASINYNGEEIDLINDSNYDNDGLNSTYTLTVVGNFSLTIKVEYVGQAGLAAKIGDTEYRSLTDAVVAVKNNETISLESDVEYPGTLVFEETGVTLDLNGHALTIASAITDYGIRVTSGSLTVKDSQQDLGKIVFSNDLGISVEGAAAEFTLSSGELASNGTGTVKIIECTDSGTVNIQGGRVTGCITMSNSLGVSKLNISGGWIEAGNDGVAVKAGRTNVSMTGGTIHSAKVGEGVYTDDTISGVLYLATNYSSVGNIFKMTSGEIISENNLSPIALYYASTAGNYIIGGDAKLISTMSPAITIYETLSTSATITVEDTACLAGGTYAIEFVEGYNAMPSVTINGGYLSCNENYITISDTYFVSFPDGKVLSIKPEGAGVYEGYYTLANKEDLGGVYNPDAAGLDPITYDYQDFEGLSDGTNSGLKQTLDAAEPIYSLGGDSTEARNNFNTIYQVCVRLYQENRNANQVEINYWNQKLSDAILALEKETSIDVSNLANGTYYVDVSFWKLSLAGYSMSNGAIMDTESERTTLTIKDGEATLKLYFGPLLQYGLWGHLESFYIYQGENVTEARSYIDHESNDGVRKEARYSKWYKGSTTSESVVTAISAGLPDEKTVEYSLPGVVEFELPYLGEADELRQYVIGMDVDAMGTYANALMIISWGTLEPTEDVEDTLSLSKTEVGLSLHEDGSPTDEVTATVLGSSGWTISCEERIEDGQTAAGIATASVTGNTITFTAVKEGTSTFVVTASKDGADPLTKEITVTVTNDAPFAADVNVSGSTAKVDISGASLSGTDDIITSTSSRITIDATSSNSQVSQAVITIDANTMKALLSALDRLGSTSPSLRFETDVGQLTLDYDVVENAAGYGQDITLEIGEIDIPDIDGLNDSDFETAYELTMSYGSRNISSLGGEVTITIPWSEDVGYAYYVDGDELAERYAMTVSGGSATWITDHFSTWALSTDRNLMEVGITEGVYSVPIVIKQADAPSRDSMANDAVGDMVVADVDEDGVTYTMFLKARIGDELGGEPLRGHLLKMWYYAPDDTSRSNPIRATVVRTYEDRDMNGDMDTFPREVEVYQEGEPNEDYYIQVSVDAMGGDSALQDALVRLDWDNALDDGGDAAREGFVDEYATEQVIDSGDSVSRSDLSDWIDEEYTLLVQGDDTYLTARFDTDALENLYDQTSSSIKFVLDEVKKSNLTDEQQEVAGDRPVYQLKITSGSKTITEIDDGTVEVTLPYELQDDENKDGLVIWLVDEDGGIQSIKFSYNSSREYVSFDTTEFGVFVIGYDAEQIWENPFTDVSEDDWFYDAVKYVVQKEMFAGTSETTFEPNLTMSRAMLVTVLYRMDGTPEVSGSSKFADVLDGQYYTDAVLWATENGIVAGYDNGLFGTNDIVSRQQMATFLYRYAQYKGYDVSLVKGLENYTDSSTVASYAIRPMQWAVANGLINGTSATTLTPTGGATRAQVAVILMRFDEAIVIPAQEKAAEETEG